MKQNHKIMTVKYSISSASLNDGCFYCGNEAKHWDHIVPKKRGGENIFSNLIPACARCNSQKSDRTLSEFRTYLRKIERPTDFDTPEPFEIRGTVSYIPGGHWISFESDDGSFILKDVKEYSNRIPHYIIQDIG